MCKWGCKALDAPVTRLISACLCVCVFGVGLGLNTVSQRRQIAVDTRLRDTMLEVRACVSHCAGGVFCCVLFSADLADRY